MWYSATAAVERRLEEAVQRADAAERRAASAQEQLEESGRRHAAAAATFEACFSLVSVTVPLIETCSTLDVLQ